MGFPAGQGVGEKDAGAFIAIVRQGRVQVLHGQADLQVRHHKRGGHDLEAEDSVHGSLFDPRAGEGAHAFAREIYGNAAQHFGQIRPGAATRVEHIDVVRSQPVRDMQVVFQRLIHAGDHIADYFGGRVPHAELFP